MNEFKIGLIGLDTSHVKVFTRMLNDPSFEHYMHGVGKVTVGYPGGSPDFQASINRVGQYTKELSEQYGVNIVDTPEKVADDADVLFITAVDGRAHPELFRKVVSFRKPVFIDKPFAVSSIEAKYMVQCAESNGIPCMSSSVRRFSPHLTAALQNGENGVITGAECYGPIEFVTSQPGWYWYGIHTVEALYAILGRGCFSVTAVSRDGHEAVVGTWRDGRIGIARGNRHPNVAHGALIHWEKVTRHVDTAADGMQKYSILLQSVLEMAGNGRPAVHPEETLEIIRFIEAANESRETGKTVIL